MLVVKQGPTYFEALAEACLAGEVTIHIDRTFGLDEAPEALAYVGDGHALGKAVVAPGWDPAAWVAAWREVSTARLPTTGARPYSPRPSPAPVHHVRCAIARTQGLDVCEPPREPAVPAM